ncbi:MAG: rRNA ((1402)-N(4))-methyltransferase RsmH [Verrucomicrobiota bacterium]|jgi:16S rRNA (cytosine1402-N4)-methyltransferase
MSEQSGVPDDSAPGPEHRRRVRYSGKNPRRFADKYKEHDPLRHAETVAKVIASGKTPAGMHRPIMVAEILAVLRPQPGEIAVDCTLGYGGHSREILAAIQPGGRLLGFDADPLELPRTEMRLRQAGYGPECFTAIRGNYAGLSRSLTSAGLSGVDCILADLGVSSMQLDQPERGFSTKLQGPLDMRMNPHSGRSAAELLVRIGAEELQAILRDHADEPASAELGRALAGRRFDSTGAFAAAIRAALPQKAEESEQTLRRVFQALRIAVNNEFSSLEMLLRSLPAALKSGGRVAILSFHSGEDRRVKKAFEAGRRDGLYSVISEGVQTAGFPERRDNPRSSCAKLRWAIKA